MVNLRDVNIENWKDCCKLKVNDPESQFVRSAEGILAKAYAYGTLARLYSVYLNEELVGLILIRYFEEGKKYVLDQMLIDTKYQRRGIGTSALKTLFSLLIDEGRYKRLLLWYIEGNEKACKFYKTLGFEHNGITDENEIAMERDLG